MSFLSERKETVRVFRHGGREVLRVFVPTLVGESAAVKHMSSLVVALEEYAERVLLPKACHALDVATKSGCGYAFLPHRYRINLREEDSIRGVMLVLETILDAQGERDERRLVSCWTKDGAFQKRRHHQKR